MQFRTRLKKLMYIARKRHRRQELNYETRRCVEVDAGLLEVSAVAGLHLRVHCQSAQGRIDSRGGLAVRGSVALHADGYFALPAGAATFTLSVSCPLPGPKEQSGWREPIENANIGLGGAPQRTVVILKNGVGHISQSP